jgi:hypothetical protein
MGSLSFTHAMATLGLRAHHCLESTWETWDTFESATAATFTFPGQSKPARPPLSRAEWDKLFANYDATGDVSALFLPQLLEVYPDAKVVVVQRDFDAWWKSFDQEVLFSVNAAGPWTRFIVGNLSYMLTGAVVARAMPRMLRGWFRADSMEGIRKNARTVYDEHYAWIRENVPEERRLEYDMKQGWAPLCAFLGKEVPDVPFPRRNEPKEHEARRQDRTTTLLPEFKKRVLRGLLGLLILIVAMRWLRSALPRT